MQISFIKKVADSLFTGSLESAGPDQAHLSSLKSQIQELQPEGLIGFKADDGRILDGLDGVQALVAAANEAASPASSSSTSSDSNAPSQSGGSSIEDAASQELAAT